MPEYVLRADVGIYSASPRFKGKFPGRVRGGRGISARLSRVSRQCRDLRAVRSLAMARVARTTAQDVGATACAATRCGGGAGEIRTREPGTPVTAFPVRTLSAGLWGFSDFQLQVALNSTSPLLQLLFNGSWSLEMPSPRARKCPDLPFKLSAFAGAPTIARADPLPPDSSGSSCFTARRRTG